MHPVSSLIHPKTDVVVTASFRHGPMTRNRTIQSIQLGRVPLWIGSGKFMLFTQGSKKFQECVMKVRTLETVLEKVTCSAWTASKDGVEYIVHRPTDLWIYREIKPGFFYELQFCLTSQGLFLTVSEGLPLSAALPDTTRFHY